MEFRLKATSPSQRFRPGDQADIGVHRVVEQIGDTLIEGVDARENALDPALREAGSVQSDHWL